MLWQRNFIEASFLHLVSGLRLFLKSLIFTHFDAPAFM